MTTLTIEIELPNVRFQMHQGGSPASNALGREFLRALQTLSCEICREAGGLTHLVRAQSDRGDGLKPDPALARECARLSGGVLPEQN